jgi:hypothetical protein
MTPDAVVLLAVLAALLAVALCAIVVLAVTLPERVARLVAEHVARAHRATAEPSPHLSQLAAVTAAQRALLIEQQKLAVSLHGLAQWLVNVALGGAGRPPQAPAPSPTGGASRQPYQPPLVQAGGPGCRPAPATRRRAPRVVVPGPWCTTSAPPNALDASALQEEERDNAP